MFLTLGRAELKSSGCMRSKEIVRWLQGFRVWARTWRWSARKADRLRKFLAPWLVSSPIFHRLRGCRHLRGSNPVSVHAKQGRGNVGHDLRRCGIHCYELCRNTAHSRRGLLKRARKGTC
jgi:hypothetical protein